MNRSSKFIGISSIIRGFISEILAVISALFPRATTVITRPLTSARIYSNGRFSGCMFSLNASCSLNMFESAFSMFPLTLTFVSSIKMKLSQMSSSSLKECEAIMTVQPFSCIFISPRLNYSRARGSSPSNASSKNRY